MAGENYDQEFPRPWPCGSLVLGFDRRKAELLGHRVHIDTGICEVSFLIDGAIATLEIFVEMTSDQALDADDRRRRRADRGTVRSRSAHPGRGSSGGVDGSRRRPSRFRQVLPALGDARDKDRALGLGFRVAWIRRA